MTYTVDLDIHTDNTDCDTEVCDNNVLKYQHQFKDVVFTIRTSALDNISTFRFKFGWFVNPASWYTFIEAFENNKTANLIDMSTTGPNIELTDRFVIFTIKTISSNTTNDVEIECSIYRENVRAAFLWLKKYLDATVDKPCFPENDWALHQASIQK